MRDKALNGLPVYLTARPIAAFSQRTSATSPILAQAFLILWFARRLELKYLFVALLRIQQLLRLLRGHGMGLDGFGSLAWLLVIRLLLVAG